MTRTLCGERPGDVLVHLRAEATAGNRRAVALLGKIATYGDALRSLEESYLFALHAADAGDAEAIEVIAEAAKIYLETVAAGHPGTEAP